MRNNGIMTAAAIMATSICSATTVLAAEVNLYSSRHYDTDTALYEEFTAATSIEVNLIEGKADELIERIKAEGANSPADVLMTVDAGRLHRAEEAAILQPISSADLNQHIPANLRHPDGVWYGLSQRVRAIVYAKDRVDPSAITSYEDLADPAWQGRICIRSSTNIYNQSLVASMIEAHGTAATEDWAKGLIANLARKPQGGDRDQIRAVAAGECDIAVVNHYYLVRLMTSDKAEDNEAAAAVGILFPNQDDRGAHANISGAGVVTTAPNRDHAIQLLEYLSTPDAQAHFALGNYEYPVVAGVELEPILAEWGTFKKDSVNAAKLGAHNAEAVKLMDRAGWQ